MTAAAPTANGADPLAGQGYETGFGSRPYRSYVLTALTLVYILNFVDRGLLSVTGPAIKPDLGISDTMFGLLTGFGFAALYTFVGLPIARIAETKHRVWIMSICIAIWSVMTALCGMAQEITIGSVVIGAVWVLLMCRVGVGIGEAGCTPPANSLIADYYPPKARSTALGYYAMGVTLGTVLANLIGGPITDAYGWRAAFMILGFPGVIVAVLLKLTVKEAPRGYTDPPGTIRVEKAGFIDTLQVLFKKPAFWTMAAATTIAAFCGYGIANFQSIFINRSFGLTAGEASIQVNVPVYLASAVGTFACGFAAERMAKKYPRAIAWLPAIGLILCVPFYWVAFTTKDLQICIITLAAGGFIKYGYLAAQYTIGQGVVGGRMRATATAILLFVINLIGYGLGPLFIGVVSDVIFRAKVQELGMAADFSRKLCEGKAIQKLAEAQQAVCKIANPESLQQSMLITASIYALGGLFFIWCCRYLIKDMVAKPV